MNRYFLVTAVVLLLAALTMSAQQQQTTQQQPAQQQTTQQQAATPAKTTSMTASLNKHLGVYVFPAKEQNAETQSKDEQACYSWAVENSGVDPMNMQKTKADTVAKGPDGSVVKGAAKGAAAGAIIGGITGDAGTGAAVGAAAGGMSGIGGKKKKAAQKQQKAEAEAIAKDQAKVDSFKKAYSACLEGKGYSVK